MSSLSEYSSQTFDKAEMIIILPPAPNISVTTFSTSPNLVEISDSEIPAFDKKRSTTCLTPGPASCKTSPKHTAMVSCRTAILGALVSRPALCKLAFAHSWEAMRFTGPPMNLSTLLGRSLPKPHSSQYFHKHPPTGCYVEG